jgi:hypothetical protein
MNGHLSKIALVSCLVLLLTACNQIGAPALKDETVSSLTASLPNVDAQTEPVPIIPNQAPITVVEPTKTQRGMVDPISPTQVIKENKAMSGTQAQPLLGDESTESINLAKQDLAQRLGVSVDSITVVAFIGQEFSTDAFYCQTTKGRIAKEESLQVVSGLSIMLSTSGRRYEYHASGQIVIFCQPLP